MFQKISHRSANELNAGSMADVAFLLLLFFLVCTTIQEDTGILVKLPPYEDDANSVQAPSRNVCRILINGQNQLFVRDNSMELHLLKDFLKSFIMNPLKDESLASNPNKAIISLQNDRATTYMKYIEVYDEIKKCYAELRNERSLEVYGKRMDMCSKREQNDIIKQIPMIISEAEPTEYFADAQ